MQDRGYVNVEGYRMVPTESLPNGGMIVPGSPVPILHVLCDAGVIPCDMYQSWKSNATRLSLNILVYFAKHRLDCPNLERYVYDWSMTSPHAFGFEVDIWGLKDLHSEPAQEWSRREEFVELARERIDDVEWLEIASTLCYIEDKMRAGGRTLTREEMIEEARGWFIINQERVPRVYDDIAGSLLGTQSAQAQEYREFSL